MIMRTRKTFIALTLLASFIPLPAFAVRTSHWTHTSEADFKSGTFARVVATNLGDVKLSRAVTTLLEQDARISAVYALVQGPDGTIYAGTGPQGVLLAIKDGKVDTAAKLEDGESIFSLLLDDQGRLLIGTGGDRGQILRLDKPGAELVEVFSHDDVQYVWSMRRADDGLLYAATGPNGQLFEINGNGDDAAEPRVVLDTNENNLLCLLASGDLLYAGTDPNGLVYRVNRKTGETFVMYDAAESEISALAMDRNGNLYAATAEATDVPMTVEGMGATEQFGRPEGTGATIQIPGEAPAEPQPPALPDPNPGQPDPIPQNTPPAEPQNEPQKMMILLAPAEPGDDGKPGEGGADAEEKPADPPVGGGGEDAEDGDGQPMAGDEHEEALHQAMHPAIGTGGLGTPREGGNAIYRIDPAGFVTEVFRQPVLVLSLIEKDGLLLAGTGSEGLVYQLNPAAEETLVLAKVDPKQVMSLLATRDGQVVLGMANVGGVASMSSGFATTGTYTSPVLDALQISRFGTLQLNGSLPAGTKLTAATRSGNVAEPSDTGWSKWSDEVDATRFVPITAPAARFFQYRLTFTSEAGEQSPVVEEVDVAYQMPNLSPRVSKILVVDSQQDAAMMQQQMQAQGGAGAGGASVVPASPVRTVAWEVSDDNGDTLTYRLYFRAGSQGPWILLKEDLTEPTFEWNTRGVADGRYEVRVVASDARDNPAGAGRSAARVSDPLVVDNTPPSIGDLKHKLAGNALQVDFKVVDRTGTVARVDYSVNSSTDWQAVLPSDNIFDSPEETVSFTAAGLTPGQHQVTIRAIDGRGNQAFENVIVTVEGPRARQ